MTPREELLALRRLAELEAKASGAGSPQPTKPTAAVQPPAKPERGLLDMLSTPFEMGANLARQPFKKQAEILTPTIEALGATGGAVLGAPGGPLGIMAGAGAGYAGAKELTRHLTGQAKPETLPQAAQRVGETAVEGAALEGLGRGIIAPVIGKAAKAAGWVWDAASGKLVNVRAGKIARKIAGADLGTIKDLANAADPNLTAAQATQPAGNNVLAALGDKAAKNDVTNYFTRTAAAQEAARKAALKSVTPNLASASGTREAAATANYAAAEAAGIDPQMAAAMQPQIDNLMNRPIMREVQNDAIEWAANRSIATPDFGSVAGLDFMKKALDRKITSAAAAAARGNSAAAKVDLATLMQNKKDLLATIEELSPLYEAARAKFAAQSAPVNQAQLLGEMQNVLAKPGGGERVIPFLNSLGSGENALIKRSGGNPRFGGIDEVLTPQQLGTVEDIAGQFNRDLELGRSVIAGKGGLGRILGETKSTVELPPSIGVVTRTVNKVLSLLEGKVNTETLDALEKGMRSGKDLAAMLNVLPASERAALLKALQQNAGMQAGRGAVYGMNALANPPKNQNAMNQGQ